MASHCTVHLAPAHFIAEREREREREREMEGLSNGDYDWAKEVKKIEETKAGVKGLVDSGITKIPKLFEHPQQSLPLKSADGSPALELPTIDFLGVQSGGEGRREVVEKIRKAAQEWGFFRIVNHSIPLEAMDAMLAAVKRFHELPHHDKAPFYTTDMRRSVKFNSNLPARENDAACWRDILSFLFRDDQLDPDEIPSTCREQVQEYVKYVIEIRETIAEVLSEALGLGSDYLSSIECMKSQAVACLYYPKCPEPNKTLGNSRHSDLTFLTLLIQDTIGGLQIRHDAQWVDVPPLRGAIIANVGDLMQIISNDKFISVEHRVLAQPVGPRISVASFFTPSMRAAAKPFAPIKELVSDETPAVYKEFFFAEYAQIYKAKYLNGTSALPHFKI